MRNLRRLVIFAILMEHGDGIVSKAPEYIEEKFQSCVSVPYPENLLDSEGKIKLKEWLKEWKQNIVQPEIAMGCEQLRTSDSVCKADPQNRRCLHVPPEICQKNLEAYK